MINRDTEYPEVDSLSGDAKKLIVFLHGYGSDGHDLIALAPIMQHTFVDMHMISPHGVEDFELAPYGRQWFSLNDRSTSAIQHLADNSSQKLLQIIKAKQNKLNLSNKDTIIIGFSQGAMLGLYLTLSLEDPFRCMISFSGRLIPPIKCINKTTPVCLIHGQQDDVVEHEHIDIIAKYCNKHNIQYSKLSIPNLRHSIDSTGLDYAISFIKNNI